MKILLLLSIHYYLFAICNFKEIRYVDAIGITQYKYGSMHILNNILTLSYRKPNQESISYESTKVVIKDDDSIQEYSFKDHPQLQYMGLLLKAIIENNYISLEKLFEIKKENTTILLKAKPIIYSIIKSIEIINDSTGLQKIIMHMGNQDKIIIETID